MYPMYEDMNMKATVVLLHTLYSPCEQRQVMMLFPLDVYGAWLMHLLQLGLPLELQ